MLNTQRVTLQEGHLYLFFPNTAYEPEDYLHPKGWNMTRMVYTCPEGIHMTVDIRLDEEDLPAYIDTLTIDNIQWMPLTIPLRRSIRACPDLISLRRHMGGLASYEVHVE